MTEVETVPLTSRPARRPSDDTRRTRIIDAAIMILAEEGARALSHRGIDRVTRLPVGSTSNFFKSRHDILIAACERIVDLDIFDLTFASDATEPAQNLAQELARIAAMMAAVTAPELQNRARARMELHLAATRDQAIRHVFVSRWQPAVVDLTESGIACLAPNAPVRTIEIYRTILTGLMVRSAFTPGGAGDREQIEGRLLALLPLFETGTP